MNLKTFVRRTQLRDLLLPVGAALVTAGLEYLADREQQTRARLAELEQAVAEHRAELGLAPEPDPVGADPLMLARFRDPWSALSAELHADDDEPAEKIRPWKLAVVALGIVAGVTVVKKRGEIIDRVLDAVGFDELGKDDREQADPRPDDVPVFPEQADPRPDEPEQADPRPDDVPAFPEQADPRPDDVPVFPEEHPTPAEQVDRLDADPSLVGCGWPGCTYVPLAKAAPARITQLATHRNRCMYRPAGAVVPGA